MNLVLTFTTIAIVVATALPLLRYSHWSVRGLDFPRLQLACLAALLLPFLLVFLDLHSPITWLLVSATALCLCWHLWWVLPYTKLWPKQSRDSRTSAKEKQLSVLTANVLQTNRNSAALIALVEEYRPDVLVTLETDQWWEDRLKAIETAMPYSMKCPLDNLYGMHVYSVLPLSEQEISYLVEEDVPSMHASLELRSGDRVRVHFFHPPPPSPTENEESIERDAELITAARSIADSDQPIVVTGDMNDVPWSKSTRLFLKISGLLDPRVGRGMFSTFHVDYFFLRWPLDHLFHSAHFTLGNMRRLPSIGSDHFALFTTLHFSGLTSGDEQQREPSVEELREAQEISGERNLSKADVPQPLEEK